MRQLPAGADPEVFDAFEDYADSKDDDIGQHVDDWFPWWEFFLAGYTTKMLRRDK